MIDKKRRTDVGVDRGREEVGQSVAGEVIEDATPGHIRSADVQAHVGRDVFELSDVELGAKNVTGDQERFWHVVGIFAERHVGEIEQPASA